ncbi:MAG: hypothetical protein V8T29_02690 [Oscillospiraceae bacterium]
MKHTKPPGNTVWIGVSIAKGIRLGKDGNFFSKECGLSESTIANIFIGAQLQVWQPLKQFAVVLV